MLFEHLFGWTGCFFRFRVFAAANEALPFLLCVSWILAVGLPLHQLISNSPMVTAVVIVLFQSLVPVAAR